MVEPADEDSGITSPGRVSAWPVFVALGLAVAEVGIVMEGLYPLAVAGLLLFIGSVAGIVHEAGYVSRPWTLLGALGLLLVLAGMLVLYSVVGFDFTASLGSEQTVTIRGWAILGAGVVGLSGGLAGRFVVDTRPAIPE